MISVAEALDQLFALTPTLPVEEVPLIKANGRVLARAVSATRNQPPFSASAMDGYAVVAAAPGDSFTVIGEAAAGSRHAGPVGAGEAVRIFTGAPVPEGATRIVIQEDVTRDGDRITVTDALDKGPHIRPEGDDFRVGQTVSAPVRLTPAIVALLASMNIAKAPVFRQPEVAILSTGDELVMPGETPGPDQIIASNTFGLHALLSDLGARPRLLPLARDNEASLRTAFELAQGADLVITIGGASVGDHDLVGKVAGDLGMDRAFYKVAMRPGKPLMAGRLNGAMMIGLPGNPVSAMVCGHVFVAPVIRAMLGLPRAAAPRAQMALAEPLPANGPREHYMRARRTPEGIIADQRQDSALLSVLGQSDALLIRAPNDPAQDTGALVDYIPI